ncbi:MAG: hypothetical protein JO242_09055 [Streptosporangiaceae bacterium]|nr:hypothetical protein [Streptosporangiaceae bacterium]
MPGTVIVAVTEAPAILVGPSSSSAVTRSGPGRRGRGVDRRPHRDAPGAGEHVVRPGEHVGDEHLRHDAQRDVPVDPARLQEVDGPGAARRVVRRDVQPA